MSEHTSTQLSTEFLKLLEGKSSLFFDHESALSAEPLKDIVTALGTAYGLPVICMHWSEQPESLSNSIQAACVIIPISRNFTSTLIRLGKLLADRQYIVLVQDLDKIAFTVARKPFCRFAGVLTDKCRERHSTLLAFSEKFPYDPGHDADISRLFDNRFRIDTKALHKVGTNGRTESSYSLFGEELGTVQSVDTDMEKIKEIFRLTPEEQEELDMIASRQIRDLNIN